MLLDRAAFLHVVERRLAGPAPLPQAMLLLNVDRFEVVVDQLGHAAGDEALQVISDRLERCVGPTDVVARLRGDEFAALLPGATSKAQALALAERIGEILRAPLTIGPHRLSLTASIGVAVADDNTEASSLLRNANIAMCQAKEAGRARYSIFDASMRQRAWERMCLETELRQALANDEFVVFYQPIVDLGSWEAVGYEALVRWQHPVRGLVGPAAFIRVAEESGLIVQIGEKVLAAACRQASVWHRANQRSAPSISVNLSARQLEQSDALIATVRDVLERTQLDPGLLKLEITESSVMRDPELSIATLWALRGLGLQLVVDDFGTGYSSLAYLKRFPVSTLKIDRSFVEGVEYLPEDHAIVSATIAFARALEVKVVAEGIESEPQACILRELGCHFGQGYLWGRPAPVWSGRSAAPERRAA
jgi:diguanylate cyclase (GGDEF)-like protein